MICSQGCSVSQCPQDCEGANWYCDLEGVCRYQDLPNNNLSYLVWVLVAIASFLSSMVGIGGGGLLLPIFILIGGYGYSYAIPLTLITIAGNSGIRLWLLYSKKHTYNPERYLIYFGIIPFLSLWDANGAFLGFILQSISTALVQKIVLIALLGLIGGSTLQKAYRLFRVPPGSDSAAATTRQVENIYIDGISWPIQKYAVIDGIEVSVDPKPSRAETLKDRYRWMKRIVGIIVLFFFLVYFRNRLGDPTTYYLSYLVQTVIALLWTRILWLELAVKNQTNYQTDRGDLNLDYPVVREFCFVSFVIGCLSTYLGIGGGILMAPYLLRKGLLFEVVSGTNAVTTFFSALTSFTQYIFTPQILPITSGIYFVTAGIFAYLGCRCSIHCMKRGWQHYLVGLLGAVIVLCGVIMLFN